MVRVGCHEGREKWDSLRRVDSDGVLQVEIGSSPGLGAMGSC